MEQHDPDSMQCRSNYPVMFTSHQLPPSFASTWS